MDMNVAYEAFKASSGNSFVHETESQVILNGSRDISFYHGFSIKGCKFIFMVWAERAWLKARTGSHTD